MATAIVINKAQMGHGHPELGVKLLGTLLRKAAGKLTDLEVILLYNDGVRLACKDSPIAVELHQLHEKGVDILACGTCLDFLNLRDQFAFPQPSNMDEILQAMNAADKVITL